MLSAEFYGASYAVFPPFDATAHFDITLKFRTDFGDGLLLFAGSALQVGTSLEQYSLPNIIPLISIFIPMACCIRTLCYGVENHCNKLQECAKLINALIQSFCLIRIQMKGAPLFYKPLPSLMFQGTWVALTLNSGRLSLLFQARSNSPLSLSRGSNLHDGSLHSVTVIRSGFK